MCIVLPSTFKELLSPKETGNGKETDVDNCIQITDSIIVFMSTQPAAPEALCFCFVRGAVCPSSFRPVFRLFRGQIHFLSLRKGLLNEFR